MLVHPQFDPVAIHLGPLAVRWYGLMYLVGFLLIWAAARYRIRHDPDSGWTQKEFDDVLFYGILGVILGGRLGYVLFYKFGDYLAAPWKIFYVWEGGMSFHGGFLGVIFAMWLFARSRHKRWLQITDFIGPLVPLGLAAGRIGNFINGELWGRPASVSWAMIFPQVDNIPRHPSQLYEAFFEGPVLFLILWLLRKRTRMPGELLCVFLVTYGLFRFSIEFLREPDVQLGFVIAWLTMGQILCLSMIVAGIGLFVYLRVRGVRPPQSADTRINGRVGKK